MGLLLVELAVIASFVGLGVLFSKGKGAFLIAGYNTASRSEKENYDEKALCRFMGKLMAAMARRGYDFEGARRAVEEALSEAREE